MGSAALCSASGYLPSSRAKICTRFPSSRPISGTPKLCGGAESAMLSASISNSTRVAAMSSIEKPVAIRIEEYLDGEEHSEVRHEYVAGSVYAMVGSSSAHNAIALNLATALRAHLRGGDCRVFMSDMKVRIGEVFYYPDVLVSCEPWDRQARFQSQPVLVIEVLSDSTERKDRFEKRVSYQSLASLQEYVLISQDRPQVEIFRRVQDAWELETCLGGDEVCLRSVELVLPMEQVYEGV